MENTKIFSDVLKPQREGRVGPPLDRISQLFFLSFKFSQGESSLQFEIFTYIKYLHPEWIISDDLKKKIGSRVADPIRRLISQKHFPINGTFYHTFHKYSASAQEEELENIGEAFEKKRAKPNIYYIAKAIIEQDRYFLIEKGGRPRSPNKSANPASDKWLSHIVHYGLEGHTTHTEEFDGMFSLVKQEIMDVLTGKKPEGGLGVKEDMGSLGRVIEKHIETHPEDKNPVLQEVLNLIRAKLQNG